MAASRVLRGLLCAAALLCLVFENAAQGKRGRGPKRGGPPKSAAKKPGGGQAPMTIPGFDAPTGAKSKKPTGPKGKKPTPAGKGKTGSGAKPPAQAPDPMTEADRVAQEAEARARLESADDKRLKELFALCDLDQNGWISLREAELVLSFDRAEYRRADADQDGRLVAREYAAQKTLVFSRLGAPPEAEKPPEPAPRNEPPDGAPQPEGAAKKPPREKAPPKASLALPGVFPRPSDLLQRYDKDASKGLGSEEVERLLVDLGLDFSVPLVVAQMDRDDDGNLGPAELLPLSLLASRHVPEEMKPKEKAPVAEKPAPAAREKERPKVSVLESMTPFGRLDRDRDGFVGESDLQAMQGLARTDARLGALLSALDADGDRKLSRAEFERAMGSGGN
jgi:Ca2+-binding EF-hand superfamily protein